MKSVPSLRRLALPVLLAAASVAVAGPASADVTGSTSTSDVVLYNQCQQHDIHYDLRVSSGTSYWRLEIQVFNPVGATSQGSVLTSATSPRSGTVKFQFCGSERVGTYTVRGTGFSQVAPAVQIPYRLPDTTFEVRPVATRTSLSSQATAGGHSRLTVRVREQSPDGWSRSDGILFRLERLVDGQWRKVPGTTLTTVDGLATTSLRTGHATKVRAVTPARHNYGASSSTAVPLGA